MCVYLKTIEVRIMIITISGKPCTGKSTMAEIFVKKYGFERVYAGAIFKSIARDMGIDIVDLAKSDKVLEIDHRVDDELKSIYNSRFNENLLIESRTAWSFMPNAFNVFIDVSDEVMAERLFKSDRSELERGSSMDDAKNKVMSRYNIDVARYKKLYNIDCSDLNNYDLIVDNSNLTPEETADLIYAEYIKRIK